MRAPRRRKHDEAWRARGPLALEAYERLAEDYAALVDSGFAIDRFLEPRPTDEFEEADPEDYAKLMRRPGFL